MEDAKNLELDLPIKPNNGGYFAAQSKLFQEEKRRQEEGRIGLDLRFNAFPRATLGSDDCRLLMPVDIEGVEPQAVYGIRGVIVDYGHGMQLYDGVKGEYVCWSVGAYKDDALGNEEFIRKSAPAIFPIPSAEKYGERGTPHERIQRAKLRGARGKTCAECISCGEHVIDVGVDKPGEDGEEGRSKVCSPYGFVVFYVTEVLIKVRGESKKINGRRVPSSLEYVWARLAAQAEDGGMVWMSEIGEPYYEKPTMIGLKLPGGATRFLVNEVDTAKGKKISRLNTTSYAGSQAGTLERPYTPGDVRPWRTFIEDMLKERSDLFLNFTLRVGGTDYDTVMLGAVVELYATQPIVTTSGVATPPRKVATIPTLRIADVSKEYLYAALRCAQEEYRNCLEAAHLRREERRQGEEEVLEFFEPEETKPLPQAATSSAAELLQNTVSARYQQRL